MVKGVSKRIIVVKNPDQRFFEQAIFILRSDSAAQGVSEKELLRQARRAANDYLRRGGRRFEAPLRRFRGLLCALAGAALTAGTWFAVQLLFSYGYQ